MLIAGFLSTLLVDMASLAPDTPESLVMIVDGQILTRWSPSVAILLPALLALNLIELVSFDEIAMLRLVFLPMIEEYKFALPLNEVFGTVSCFVFGVVTEFRTPRLGAI